MAFRATPRVKRSPLRRVARRCSWTTGTRQRRWQDSLAGAATAISIRRTQCSSGTPADSRQSSHEHLSDVSRRCRYGHRIKAPSRGLRHARAGGLRPVPGAQGVAPAQLGAASNRSVIDSCGGSHARAPRSLRVPAPPRREWIQGAHLLHGSDGGPVPHRAARCGKAAGRRCREREPARLLQARPGAPTLYERAMPLAPGIQLEYINAGHLLGSAYASVRSDGLHVLFGGDLGRYNRPVLPDPSPVAEADVLLVESTYGNRTHPAEDDGEVLAEIVRSTAEKRGRVVVPSFAIGRVEELLYWIKRLEDEKRIPVLPVWVDSPMAASALRHYAARVDELDPELRTSEPAPKELRAVAAFATDRLKIVSSPQESRDLVASRVPAIVISSSGMATGGRVLNHLREALPRPENTVLFVGFQAAGTRGRQLIEGARTVRIQGTDVPVNARVEKLNSMSAHADRTEIMRWLRHFRRPPSRTFIVHGEPDASAALKEEIARELEWTADIAGYLQKIELAPAR